MAQNFIEYHINRDSRKTFKVAAAETLYAGDPVSIKSDGTVGRAAADDEAVIGIVYGGTVGNAAAYGAVIANDYTNAGFSGARKDVVTVILGAGHLVYLKVTSPVIGKPVVATGTAAGTLQYKVPADNAKPLSHLGKIVAVNTKVAGFSLVQTV
ncbi:hypothetical protein [Bacillus toyonensis]|uniref:hypothetical protein n=1 Tax=Bacillus toyonensis TaxID=155322 RepID=UPI00124D6C51|nr:hypothetical protein [Bacillus toyonensis]KAB2380189.1 hypothetical protein F8507_27270 [Bacillus toyonensis]